jgi:hypothetical protein
MDIWVYVVGLFALSVIGRLLKKKTPGFKSPPRIQLYAATAGGKHAKDLIERKRDLDACGLKRLGTYHVDPLNVIMTAFANEQESICAVVYHHSMVGCFVDVCAKNTAGKSFTATSAPSGGTLDQREGHEKVFDKTLTIPVMFEMVKTRRPEGPWEPWTRENFAAKFEQAYAEEMDWRASRGGVTSDEVRRTAQASGKTYSEETIQKATQQLQQQYTESRRDLG